MRKEIWRCRQGARHPPSTPQAAPAKALRLCFITTWYGPNISGGAEAECYGLVQGLARRFPELTVEVVTTTLRDFSSSWTEPVHKPGRQVEDRIVVHRFHPSPWHSPLFAPINDQQLCSGDTAKLHQSHRSPLTRGQEAYYLRTMVYSEGLLQFLGHHRFEYDLFIGIPYMFAPVALGLEVVRERSVVIPCLHDERHIFLRKYRQLLEQSRANLFHVRSEMRLAESVYHLRPNRQHLIGEQVDTSTPRGNGAAFAARHQLTRPYILYAGRKIAGKNLPLAVEYFRQYAAKHPHRLQFVMIGSGDLHYSGDDDIRDLGFVSPQDKLDAMAGCLALFQPSALESFSIVIMEAWLQGAPVLVNAECAVTRDHCEDSGGGFVLASYSDFERACDALLDSPSLREQMATRGAKYCRQTYSPDRVLDRVHQVLQTTVADSGLERS